MNEPLCLSRQTFTNVALTNKDSCVELIIQISIGNNMDNIINNYLQELAMIKYKVFLLLLL